MTIRKLCAGAVALLMAACAGPGTPPPAAPAVPAAPAGQIKGRALEHNAASRAGALAQAQVALPASSGAAYFGRWKDLPAAAQKPVPVVLFLHGSSGLGLAAIAEWQRWLAGLGIASVAPDSFALPDRLTYTSPIDKATYERVHALRGSEADLALQGLRGVPWADAKRLVLAGTSEGAVAVARHEGSAFAGRLIYAWSCEDNYFVQAHGTRIAPAQPVLNVISSTDPFFSPANAWLGNASARGHCGAALTRHQAATVVLIAGAPHTLLNLPPARHATEGFLRDLLKP
ncbi:MAG: alpha/beta hydrolase [Rubrivivax sp.]